MYLSYHVLRNHVAPYQEFLSASVQLLVARFSFTGDPFDF